MNVDKQDSPFSILTLNLRFGKADDGPDSWENRKGRYAAFFKKYRPDFICMQETNNFQADFFKKILAEYHSIGQRIPAPSYWQDNMIFFKNTWECLKHDRLFISHTPSVQSKLEGSKWPRQYVVASFKMDEKSLICVNTHFDFDASVQMESAKIIISDSALSHSQDTPVIITGDFNAEPDSPCYMELTSDDVPGGRFNELFNGSHSCTYHGFTGVCTGRHIDWILFRGPVKAVEKKIIRDKFNGGYPSDHYPVLARFQWDRTRFSEKKP